MLTEARWQKEQELMQSVFPEFKAFVRGARFGFKGYLRGPSSGQIYGVTLEADMATYPQSPPSCCMHPRIGIHWIGEGESRRLCVEREWRPARSTFTNTLLALIKYLREHDHQPPEVPQRAEVSQSRAAQPQADEGNSATGDASARRSDVGSTFWTLVRSWHGRGPY